MLSHELNELRPFARVGKEYFALSVLYVFLNVECHSFRNAEILHVVGDVDAKCLAEGEEMVYGMARVEHDGGVVQYLDFLLAELLCSDAFHLDERVEDEFYVVVFLNVKIGGFF